MKAPDRFLRAIGYPLDSVREEEGGYVLQVDGAAVRVAAVRDRLVVSRSFGDPDDETLRSLAQYAAGRLLREEAVLAWDPDRRELVLWQEIPDVPDEGLVRRAFELFCTSCEWWAERCVEPRVDVPEMMIRP